MTIRRRSSRADRRRTDLSPVREERRKERPVNEAQMHSRSHNQCTTIYVTSTLCATNRAQAKAMMEAYAARTTDPTVLVDLEKCPYMDTQGLSLLFEFRNALLAVRRAMVLQNPSRPVQRIINITQMARLFSVRITSDNMMVIPSATLQTPATQDTQDKS